MPGRPKTDKLDAVWLAKLTEKGLLRPSFVPFDINKNFFRITSLEVAFDVDGMLVGLSSASTSAVSTALEAAAGASAAFTAGAESVQHAQKALLETKRTTAAAELSRARHEIERHQDRLLAVGPGATLRIQRLRNRLHVRSILEAQSRVSGADPALAGEIARHSTAGWAEELTFRLSRFTLRAPQSQVETPLPKVAVIKSDDDDPPAL